MRFFLILLFFVPVQAQTLKVAITDEESLGMGYRSFAPGVSVALEGRKGKVGFDAEGQFSLARKTDYGGYNIRAQSVFRYYLTQKTALRFGVRVSQQRTSIYSKATTNPIVGLQTDIGSLRYFGDYLHKDLTSPNKIRGARVGVEYFGKSRIYLKGSVSVLRFQCFQAQMCTGAVVSYGVGFWRGSPVRLPEK